MQSVLLGLWVEGFRILCFAKASSWAGRRQRCLSRGNAGRKCWVAVKEIKLSYHNGYIYIVNNRISPI